MDIPNSLIIFIPLFDLPVNIDFLNRLKPKNLESLDIDQNFNKFQKQVILHSNINVKTNEYKDFFKDDISKNVFKLDTKLTLYQLQAKKLTRSKDLDLFFLSLDFYSKHQIDYKKTIQHYFVNHGEIFELIYKLLKENYNKEELNEFYDYLLKNKENNRLRSFNLLFYNYNYDINKIANHYRTGLNIIKEYQYTAAVDYYGKTILWVNHINSTHSSFNLKIISLRCFLLRLFSMISHGQMKTKYINLLSCFYNYIKFLKERSTNSKVYSEFLNHNKFKIDFEFKLAIFDTFNESYFLTRVNPKERIKPLEAFLDFDNPGKTPMFKYAFITNDRLSGRGAGLDYLEKHGWNIILCSKATSKTDYDSALQTFILQLSSLNRYKWSQIFIISTDSDMVNHFIKGYPNSKITIISSQKNSYLEEFPNLYSIEVEEDEFEVYYSK